MWLLKEAITKIYRIDNKQDSASSSGELDAESLPYHTDDRYGDLDLDIDNPSDDNDDALEDQNISLDLDDADSETDLDLDDVVNQASDDPDKQGLIRTVKKAHLVFKRQSSNGTFEELWVYNLGTLRDELETRKAILAGTDIPTTKTKSPDGTQSYTIWTAGNVEMLHVIGLPN